MSTQISIIKIGGAVIDDATARAEVLRSIANIKHDVIVVHGGGKVATELSAQLGIETQMVDGRRITDADSLRVVTMVYAGLINTSLVAELQALGCNAIGLSGADADLIRAHKRVNADTDFGFVGDIDLVNADTLRLLLKSGMIPVIAPITHDGAGQLLNTNADTIASTIALALSSHATVELILCFDKPGVLRDPDDESSVITTLDTSGYASLRQQGAITKGMIAKCDNAFAAARMGVRVRLCSYSDFQGGTVVVV